MGNDELDQSRQRLVLADREYLIRRHIHRAAACVAMPQCSMITVECKKATDTSASSLGVPNDVLYPPPITLTGPRAVRLAQVFREALEEELASVQQGVGELHNRETT